MAYVPARKYGMAAYHRRRGLGISCPGDPSCPGYVDPNLNAAILAGGGTCTCQPNGTCQENGNSCAYTPVTAATSTAAQALALQQQAAVDTSTLTGWLNVNSGLVTVAGIGLALLMFMGGRRR